MEQNRKTFHPIRGFFGFILTIILIVLLLVNGILFPMKITIIKGSSVSEVLKNLGFHALIYDMVNEEISDNSSSLGMGNELADKLLTEDVVKDICDVVVDAIFEDKDVDLSFLNEYLISTLKSEVNTTIDSAFDEIETSSKVIDADTLANNSALKAFNEAYGVDVSGLIMSAIASQYGVDSVDLNYIDIKTVEEFVTDSLETVIYPEVDSMSDSALEEANEYLNNEIAEMFADSDFKEYLAIFETAIKGMSVAVALVLAIIAVIAVIQLFMYHSCIYRAFRNFAISTFFSGATIALFGFLAKHGLPMVLEDMRSEVENESVIDFMNNAFAPFAKALITFGLIYLAVFAVCFILSLICKAAYKKK